MRNFLVAFAVTLLMATSALANHLPPTTVGQERNERVWLCKTLDDALAWSTSKNYKDSGKSSVMFTDYLQQLVVQGRCVYAKFPYKVDAVMLRVSVPMAGQTNWLKDATLYTIRIITPTGKIYYLATS